MESIVDGRKEEIKDKKKISFSVDPGYYLIVISARVKGKQQISPISTDDEDLTIQIDKKTFPKISDKDRLKDSPAAFSGGSLHGLLKTVYIVTALSGKRHSVILATDEPAKTAVLESLEVFKLNLTDSLNININSQAEDGDRRPWVTLALDNLSLKSLTATVTYSHRKQDSDDIKIVDDPEWTGDFADDTEEILLARAIYGEAGGESKEAKVAVAWTIKNRVEDNQNRWGKTYHKVILQSFQYEPFNNPGKDPFKKIANPPLDNKGELQAWRDSFETAEEVIQGKVSDPTKGANHFYVPSDQPKQSWVDEKRFTVQIGVTRFYKL